MPAGSLILTDGLGLSPSGGAGTPSISNIIPAVNTPIGPNDAVQFDITEVPPPGLGTIFLWVLIAGNVDRIVIWNKTAFVGSFAPGSTVATIANGFRFTIKMFPHWAGSIQGLTVEAIDINGGEVSATLAWPLSAPPSPPVPPPGPGNVTTSYKAQQLLGFLPPAYDTDPFTSTELWAIGTAIGNSDNDIGGQ